MTKCRVRLSLYVAILLDLLYEFQELKEFITTKMIMQHVYQPVMIKTLLESGNKASVGE